jgi:hypothetical protein
MKYVWTLVLILLLAACNSTSPTPPPVIQSFSATPADLPTGGGEVTLQWTVEGATALSIDSGVGAVTGTSKTVTVTASTTFTLTASNAAGTVTKTADVTVASPPASLDVDPPARVVVADGPAVSFTANLVGAQGTVSWTLSGPGSVAPESGMSTLYTPPDSVDAPQTATLTAALADSALSDTVTITINPVGTAIDTTLPTVSLSSSAGEVTAAGAITLSAIANDNIGVSKVVFFEGATRLGEDDTAPYTFERSFTRADNGSYSYTATAFDAAGNSGSSDPITVTVAIPANEDLLTEENAWKGEIPADAEQVSPEEFRRRVEAGELVLSSTASEEAQRAALERQFKADKAFLASIPDPGPALRALLEEAGTQQDFEGDQPFQTPGGMTMLEGLGTQLRNAVLIHELAQSAGNALDDYRLSYALLPDDVKAKAASPDSLAGKSLAEVREALSNLDALLADVSELDNTRLEGDVPLPPDLSTQAIRPGQGRDQDSSCATPTGYAARHWFPLKRFISPMKNQGMRGTCWAFTAVGAVESRERVQNNNPVNLSEQFLVNKVKQDWDSSDYTEGYNVQKALDTAIAKRQALLGEGDWTYNAAQKRPDLPDGKKEAYAGACDPYGKDPNAGTCSETAHQSRRVCTTFVFTFCGYAKATFSGPGVAASPAVQIWASGQSFDLNRYRLLLAQGHVIMASFRVYQGFSGAAGGVVSSYTTACGDKAGKACGGHAVQIVGFLSNAELSTLISPVNIGGGGYFIVKNSWGCGAGDGGYYYVPADYVQRLFTSLSVLQFDTRRSDTWNREQATPGGSEAPTITLNTSPPPRADLRVSLDLARFFKVSHPVTRSVTLTVSGSGLGTIYSGPWSTATDVLIGSSLPYTFRAQGRQVLTLVARYGSSESRATLNVEVVNSAPTLELQSSGDPRQGEPYAMTALVRDINESDATRLCANTTWAVDAPDALSSTTGCGVRVTFGETGARSVRVSTRDSEGLTASATRTLTVLPPPENPYPRITSTGVYSRDLRRIDNTPIGCTDVAVANGNTIDFREKGCTNVVIINPPPPPPRYSAQVGVENPSGEALTYDWRVFVTVGNSETEINRELGSSSPSFTPYSPGNAIDVTNDCRVTLTVNAPEPSRSKSLTVWTGKCTYYSTRLN